VTKGKVIAAAEQITGNRIDSAMPQDFFDKAGELLGENPQAHFIGWSYSQGSAFGGPLPMTVRGWEVTREIMPALFGE